MYIILTRYKGFNGGGDWRIYTPPGEAGPVILDKARAEDLARSSKESWHSDLYEIKIVELVDIVDQVEFEVEGL